MRLSDLSLSLKLPLAIGAILFPLLGGISWMHAQQLQQRLLDGVSARGQGIAAPVIAEIKQLAENSDHLNWVLGVQNIKVMQQMGLEQGPDLRHIAVMAPDGRIRAHTDPQLRGRMETEPKALDVVVHGRKAGVVTDGIFRAMFPVFQGQRHIGTVCVGLDSAEILAQVQSLFLRTLGLSLLFILAGTAALYLLMRALLLQRILRLQTATARFARGDFDAVVAVQGRDELGQLGRGVAEMGDSIREKIHALEHYQEDLEQQVRLRTEELQLALQDAKAANQAKSVFLANMSHELRTPMNAILGYAQILAEEPALAPPLRPAVETVRRSGEYLLLLIDDILDLAKIEAGRLELFPAPFDLDRFLRELTDIFSARARAKGLELNYQRSSELPAAIRGDEKRLRQICMNLLGNAVKFTERGEVRLEAGYREGWVEIAVADTGIGIRSDQVGELFQVFQQAGASEYRQQGTGLGLAIAKQLADAMNGEIQVQSRHGQGSRFTLSLPLPAEPAACAAQNADSPLHATGYQRSDGIQAPLRLLTVDDDVDNRLVLRGLLTPLGFEIAEAASGPEAVRLARQTPPDLILMDLVMPGMDGLEATRAILAEQTLPVVAVSARNFEEDRAQSRAVGCCEHLGKPLRLGTLLKALQRHLPLEWKLAPPPSKPMPMASPDQLAKAVAALPPALREQLKSVVLEGNGPSIQQTVVAIADLDAGLGARLDRWLTVYEYQRVLDLLEAAKR